MQPNWSVYVLCYVLLVVRGIGTNRHTPYTPTSSTYEIFGVECFEHLVTRFAWEQIIWMLSFHVLMIGRLHDRNFLTIKTHIRLVTLNMSRMYLFHCILSWLWSSSLSSVCCCLFGAAIFFVF